MKQNKAKLQDAVDELDNSLAADGVDPADVDPVVKAKISEQMLKDERSRK